MLVLDVFVLVVIGDKVVWYWLEVVFVVGIGWGRDVLLVFVLFVIVFLDLIVIWS